MYTLIPVYVHFNRFIDLTINSHTNPHNLASSRLFDSGSFVAALISLIETENRDNYKETIYKEKTLLEATIGDKMS